MRLINLKQNKSEDIMKNQKVRMMEPQIAAQNAETPRNPNTGGMKIPGSNKNINTSGANCGGTVSKGPNTSQIK